MQWMKMLLSAASEFPLPVRMQPVKQPKGFSRNHHAGYFLELSGEKAHIVLKAPGSHSLSL